MTPGLFGAPGSPSQSSPVRCRGAWPPHWYPLFPGPSDVALDLETGEVWCYDFPWGGANIWLAESLPDLAARIVKDLETGPFSWTPPAASPVRAGRPPAGCRLR